jgi:DNA-binding CsgD family transcriptional regulator
MRATPPRRTAAGPGPPTPMPTPAERMRGLTRVHHALRSAATVEELLARAADLARESCGFDRVVVLGVGDGVLTATDSGVLEDRESDLLRRRVLCTPVAVESRSPEAHVVRGHGAAIGVGPVAGPLAAALGLAHHVLAGITPESWVVGLVVLDRAGPPVDETDAAVAELFATFLAMELERVVQRSRAADLAAEVQQHQAASAALTRELLDGRATLSTLASGPPLVQLDVQSAVGGTALRDLLSDAEIRTATLLARGLSNRQIAEELIVSPETVKTHVARILRKLGAANRAEAVYRLMELSRSA